MAKRKAAPCGKKKREYLQLEFMGRIWNAMACCSKVQKREGRRNKKTEAWFPVRRCTVHRARSSLVAFVPSLSFFAVRGPSFAISQADRFEISASEQLLFVIVGEPGEVR